MAVAVKERRPVRGAEAVAERPDGSRVHFRPYPTPFNDRAGEFAGAFNLLLDISDQRDGSFHRQQAAKCRRLAKAITDRDIAHSLSSLANRYEQLAESIKEAGPLASN